MRSVCWRDAACNPSRVILSPSFIDRISLAYLLVSITRLFRIEQNYADRKLVERPQGGLALELCPAEQLVDPEGALEMGHQLAEAREAGLPNGPLPSDRYRDSTMTVSSSTKRVPHCA